MMKAGLDRTDINQSKHKTAYGQSETIKYDYIIISTMFLLRTSTSIKYSLIFIIPLILLQYPAVLLLINKKETEKEE